MDVRHSVPASPSANTSSPAQNRWTLSPAEPSGHTRGSPAEAAEGSALPNAWATPAGALVGGVGAAPRGEPSSLQMKSRLGPPDRCSGEAGRDGPENASRKVRGQAQDQPVTAAAY